MENRELRKNIVDQITRVCYYLELNGNNEWNNNEYILMICIRGECSNMRKNKKVISFMILSAMALASVTSVSGATKSNMKTKTIAVGDTVSQLEDSTENAANYKWMSSNKAVATVNKKGIVTAKKEGTAVITEISKVGKKEKRVLTTFKVVSLKKQGTKTVVAGEKLQLSKKQYKGATYQWTTSDRSIATVNKKGEVIGNGQGTAVIRCYAQSSKKSYIAQYTIKVNTEKKVVTQSQLTKALSNDKLTSIVIETKKDVDFVVPEGEYMNIDLSVNAPNADVENHGVFKSIKILMIKPNTWHEKANGNKIVVKALQARIVVEDGANVDAVKLAKKNAELKVEVNGKVGELQVGNSKTVSVKANGTIEKLSVNGTTDVKVEANGSVKEVAVNSAAKVDLSGNTKEEIPVSVSENAKGAKVNTAVKVKVDTKVNVEVSLEKGAEGSAIKVSDDKVAVAVKNETTDKVIVSSPSGEKEIHANGSSSSNEENTVDSSDSANQGNGNTGSNNNNSSSNESNGSNGNTSTDTGNSQTMAQQSGLQIVNVEPVENGKVRLTLNKAYPELKQEMLSIICTTGGSDMTIQRLEPSSDYKTFDIITAYYDDNGYSLAIVFSDNSLIEKNFVSKYDCPQLTSVTTTRTSDTEAMMNYIADEAGTFYYILKEDITSRLRTKAVHQVPNELDGVTENDMLQNGTKVEMKSQANEFKIDGLKQGSAYTMYYMAASKDGKTTLIKKITIDSEVVVGDSSSISIEKAEGYYKYVSFFGENYRYEITLSEPTKEALTLDNFKVSCPIGDLTIGRVETTDNQHYTVYMKSGVIPEGNNYFTATITFNDGTSAQKSFYVDFDAPLIYTTSSSVSRTGEKELEVTLKSNEEGSIYWTLLQASDDFDPNTTKSQDPKIVMDANPIKQAIVSGEGKFTISLNEIPEKDSYFAFVTEDANGNRSEFIYYLVIPEYVPPVDSGTEEPEKKTFEFTSMTAARHMTGCLQLYFGVEGGLNIAQEGTKIEIVLPTGVKKEYTLLNKYVNASSSSLEILDIQYASGTYTITVTLPDGSVGTKTFIAQ